MAYWPRAADCGPLAVIMCMVAMIRAHGTMCIAPGIGPGQIGVWIMDNVEKASRGWITEPTVFINDIEVTGLQAESIREVYRRPIGGEKPSFEEFTAGLVPMVAGDGAVVLPWCNMFLAIESDGHIHS